MASVWYASHEGVQYWVQYDDSLGKYELTSDTTHELVGGGFSVTLTDHSPEWVWEKIAQVFGAEKAEQIRGAVGIQPDGKDDTWPSDEWKDWNTL